MFYWTGATNPDLAKCDKTINLDSCGGKFLWLDGTHVEEAVFDAHGYVLNAEAPDAGMILSKSTGTLQYLGDWGCMAQEKTLCQWDCSNVNMGTYRILRQI